MEMALQGWKARRCKIGVTNGVVTVRGTSPSPFLGFPVGNQSGPAVLRFRARSSGGGDGKVEWIASGRAADGATAKSTNYDLSSGDWQTLVVEIPTVGPIGILRLYLPAALRPVEVDWIEMETKSDGKQRRWDF